MSMTLITAVQLVGIFIAYLVITVLVPHIVVGKTLRFKNRYERFLMYTVLGNFYVINLVFVLELLHISCPATLILFTLIPCAAIKIKLEKIPFFKNVANAWDTFRRIVGGQYGLKAFRDARRPIHKARRKAFRAHVKKEYGGHIIEVILLVGIVLSLFYMFGFQLFELYGYKASDVIVHNYWINALDHNDIFVAGVYPHGFHNMVYYMHAVFGFDTYVLLRLLAFVQTVWIMMLLLCFLRLLLHAKYLPYIAVYGFILWDFVPKHAYARYYATLPQEYGMMFILPAIYCGFMFFREQRRENRQSYHDPRIFKDKCAYIKRSNVYLTGFAQAFSLTFAVHFYGTVIAGILCAGMAVGYLGWFLRKPFFSKIVKTVCLSFGIALLPLVLALCMGKPLHSAMAWGLSVITGKDAPDDSGVDDEVRTVEINGEQVEIKLDDKEDTNPDISQKDAQGTVTKTEETVSADDVSFADTYTEIVEEPKPSLKEKALGILMNFKDFPTFMEDRYHEFVLPEAYADWYIYLLGMQLGLIGIGFIITVFFRRSRTYGAMVLSSGFGMLFMTVLLVADKLGLPPLMDGARTMCYFEVLLFAYAAIFVDSVFYLLTIFFRGNIRKQYIPDRIVSILSLIGLIAFLGYLYEFNAIKTDRDTEALECNGAVSALTKIIHEEKDQTWTIISCNDEGRMAADHGFHYESFVFLYAMQGIGENGFVRIPSEKVFFFIEKVPIDNVVSYEDSGQPISEKGAMEPLPLTGGRSIYEARNRWIIMSKMYYWAEAFKTLYPNEMTVYYEDDSFICYECKQNTYRLFNFAIDYYYNMLGYSAN